VRDLGDLGDLRDWGDLKGGKMKSCPICRSSKITPLFRKNEREIVRCENCRVLFVDPMPSKKELDNLYNQEYWEDKNFRGETSLGYFAYIKERDSIEEYGRRILRILRMKGEGKKLLDVGCSLGFMLKIFGEFGGFRVFGVDLSKYAIDFGRKELGLKNLFLGDLKRAHFRDNFFDVVTCFHTIEHVAGPISLLKEMARVLKDGGTLVLATPDVNSLYRKVMGANWFSFRHREHLYFFGEESVSSLLKKAGFRKILVLSEPIRVYRFSHLLGGIRYYFKGGAARGIASVLEILGKSFRGFWLPVPLGNILVLARK